MALPCHGQLQNTRFNVGSFMCAAASSGDKDRLEWVIGLPNGVEQLEYRNGSGLSPLLIACSKGHKDCVALLLENGADLNALAVVDGETYTCLKLAEKGGHTETINLVKKCLNEIKRYGDCLVKLKREMITICSKPKNSGQELERLGKLTKVFDLKAGKNDDLFDEPLIIRACKAGNQELIEHMVDNLHLTHYANDREGFNMLHIAVKNMSDMRYCITKRFPELLSTIDIYGCTPLHIACDNNDIDYVKWLFDLVMTEMKPNRLVPPTPPCTPLKYTSVSSPPLLNFPAVEEEAEDSSTTSDASDLVQDTEQELDSLDIPHDHRKIPTSLSSSEVKLLVKDLEDTMPSVPLVPVTYKQHVKNMKLYSVNTEGENILHVMVKKNYHQLLEYILKTYPQFGSCPAQRDFWIRAEKISSPVEEAITMGHAECLNILIEAIIYYVDATQLYNDETLLPNAVIANHPAVVNVLIKHGIYKGIVKSLCVASSRDTLPLLLFYSRVVELLRDGEQYLMENASLLDWRDYLLPRVQPLWIKLASDAVDLVQIVFTDFTDLTPEGRIKQVGPLVLDHYSQHIDKPISCLNLQCFTIVQLSENEIETVPAELFSLPRLKELDLSGNQLKQLPAGPSEHDKCYPCSSLRTFTIRHNMLRTLPSWLFLLPNLVTLDAYYNKINELPTAVWISSSLRVLNLGKNRLSRLHDLSGTQDDYHRLKPSLDVLFSQLKYRESITEDVKRSSPSPEMDEENTGSTMKYDEDDDSSVLCNLKQLDLSYNKFTCMPKDLVCLAPKLEKLFLNCNHITRMDLVRDVPASIVALSMQSCDMKDASTKRNTVHKCGDILHLITGGEPTIGYCEHCNHDYLANLGSLNLKNNRLSTLHIAGHHSNTYALFPALSVLDVSNNQLLKVPDHLELLTELSSINLSDNSITVMPFSISQLNQLWVINLDNLHLTNVPEAILDSHSATELKNYLKNLHQKSQPYRRMKLMFVGESNKGKTSLLMALTRKGKVNQYQDVRLNLNRKPLSTVGVDLGDWEYAKQTSLLLAGKKVTFMTWDFGGQEEYYATHQCFLSSHALYILVWNVMDGNAGLEKLRPWLENIESRAMGAQVIVVGTHVDLWDAQSPHRPALEEAFTKKFRELYIDCDRRQRRTYPRIMEKLFFVDTNNKDHMSKLRDAVYDYALEYQTTCIGKKKPTPLLEELVPACYISLEESVREIAVELRNKKQIPILTHQDYIERIRKLYDCAKMKDTELKQATQFLHEKGILLHYDEGQLSDLYFVDPQWLCSMLAKVIAIPEVHSYHKNGFIGRSELNRVLGPREHVNTCINLMQKFEVLFELGNNRYLIPSLLPLAEEESCVIFPRSLKMTAPQPAANLTSVPAIPMGSHSKCLVRFFMLPFIPNGMFPRLSARLIATDVIEQVLSALKVDHLVDDQQLINRPHWRVWRSGITLVWRHMQIFRIVPIKLPLSGIDVVHVIQPKELVQSSIDHHNVYKGDSLMVQVDVLPDNAFTNSSTSGLQMATWLLQQSVEQINSVFENWYEEFAWKRNIDITVAAADPCPHCMKVVYEHLAPDLYAAHKRLVDEPKAREQAKIKEKKRKSILGSMTMSRPLSLRVSTAKPRYTADPLDVPQGIVRELNTPVIPAWSPGRLYGVNENVLYLFSVKLSAVSVMEKTVLTCPAHGAITINQIAPDMIFADLALSMRVQPQQVTQKHYLDEGGFGVIYAASVKLQDGETQEVVIKAYSQSDGSISSRGKGELAWHHYQSANTEGRIMASLRHPNILKLVGIALQPIRLLLEHAPLGSLKNVVGRYQDNNNLRINRYALQKVIYQVSSAMEYIHYNKIIYRDLKLANVLVFEFPDPRSPLVGGQHCRVLVKLADYGISKQIVPWGIRGMLGTPSYLPPEVILHGGKQAYTNKIDIYSFGMMLSYLFTYAKPFGKIIRPLRAYLEAEQRPDMSPKHRPGEWMYELMCWSWSSKPHHRPSFSVIRQLALTLPFTRLHYAMKVEPCKHLVTAIAVRYYKSIPPAANDASISHSYPLRNITSKASPSDKHSVLSLQMSGGNLSAVDDNAEVYYGTDFGIVGVADLQQLASSHQRMDDVKSPVTCMLIVNDYLWVGSQNGVKVFNAASKQLIGLWVAEQIVTTMILVPSGHCSDNEAIIMTTKSCSILAFTVLRWTRERLLQDIEPSHEIQLDCGILCTLLVPTVNQLWACTADSKLTVFNPGCYGNPEKYNTSDISNPCCIATVNEFVLVAAETKIQKWSTGEIPSALSTVDCVGTIMDKICTMKYHDDCHITSLLGVNDVLYAGTRGGAILAIDVDKMVIHGVMCVQTSAVKSLALLKQSSEAKVTTLKRKRDSLIINHSLHHDPQDDHLLVNFALGYHGITYLNDHGVTHHANEHSTNHANDHTITNASDNRPQTYNVPTMTSQCRYQQPVPVHEVNDLYMLLWSAHPW